LHIYFKMRIDIKDEIEIPEGITALIDGENMVIKKDSNELRKKINPLVNVKIEGNKIIIEAKLATKKEKKVLGTSKAHFNNMILGLKDKFKYKLEAASIHFPMNITFDKGKNQLIIKNFLGEKVDRIIKIEPGIEVTVNKNIIELESVDIEKAGQAAASIEKGAKVRKKDRRIFQDGIYITEKPGRSFL